MTSLGGSPVESDAWHLDFVLTGSQKALGLPPGLALGVASERMLERARKVPERGAYLDVVAFDAAAADYQPTHTPAIPLLYALEAQLQRVEAAGGIEARWRRHEAMRQAVETWIDNRGEALGFSFLPPPGRRSWTVSCLGVPRGRQGRDVAQAVKREGWTIGSGYGKLKPTTIRIGHMGDHAPERVRELLEALERAVR